MFDPMASRELSIEEVYKRALDFVNTGRQNKAAELCLEILKHVPQYFPALNLLGRIALGLGKTEVALGWFHRAANAAPQRWEMHYNLAATLSKNGRLEKAVPLCRRLTALSPGRWGGHVLAAGVFSQTQRHKAAIGVAALAVTVDPCRAKEALFWFSRSLNALQRFPAAVGKCRQLLSLDPLQSDVYHNLALCLMEMKSEEASLASWRQALLLDPGRTNCWRHMADLLLDLKRPKEALAAWRRAKEQAPGNSDIWESYEKILLAQSNLSLTPELTGELSYWLANGDPVSKKVLNIVALLFENLPPVKKLMEGYDGRYFVDLEDRLSDPVAREDFTQFSKPLFRELFYHHILSLTRLETFLSAMRRHLLSFAVDGRLAAVTWPGFPYFVTMLAMQCFLNDYAWYRSDEEETQLVALQDRVSRSLVTGRPVPEEVALLGAYRPLHSHPFAQAIKESHPLNSQPMMRPLIKRQIVDHWNEHALMGAIPTLTPIKDRISQAVRQQYEENPYPRWHVLGHLRTFNDANAYLRWFLPFNKASLPPLPPEPDILIAGCGTGHHPLLLAKRLPSARILAIDLSRASLAYAMRMAKAMNVQNVRFAQADLLALGRFSQRFDIIESVGVLHHLAEPEIGLEALLMLLKEGGCLKLGLYSETARQSVISSHRLISVSMAA